MQSLSIDPDPFLFYIVAEREGTGHVIEEDDSSEQKGLFDKYHPVGYFSKEKVVKTGACVAFA
jgi:hypothetical protein